MSEGRLTPEETERRMEGRKGNAIEGMEDVLLAIAPAKEFTP